MDRWIELCHLNELNEITIVVRLVLALVCGGILGIERTRKQRAAGMRTYMLVCIGAALVMMTAQFMTTHFDTDPSRMPAQVVCGIGFLGAGTIMVTRHYRVKGLTTAAGLWVSACIGMAIGIGFYFAALISAVVLLTVLLFADWLENWLSKQRHRMQLFVLFREFETVKPFSEELHKHGLELYDMEIAPSDSSKCVGLFFLLRLKAGVKRDQVLNMIEHIPGVLFVEEIVH